MVDNITVSYRNGHTALRSASFEIPRGTITALVGVNGAGKSTLFKAIMGFVKSSAGKIEVLGGSVKDALKENLVAYVPQNEEIDWDFPVLVKDVVMMGRYGHMGILKIPKQKDHDTVKDSLKKVGMAELADRQISELSGGQRKRVFLARALAQQSRIILMDEPCSALDPIATSNIEDLMSDLAKEYTIIIVTHSMQQAARVSQKTAYFHLGNLIEYGDTKEIFVRPKDSQTEAYISGKIG